MFSLNKQEISSLRTLTLIPICVSLLFILFASKHGNLEALKQLELGNKLRLQEDFEITTNKRTKNPSLNSFSLNEATLDELVQEPKIGIKYAKLILQERKKRIFSNWEDFENRFKEMGKENLDYLQSQGLRVNSEQ